ncbi:MULTISPECIES: hypothetical protein, partial [unclassified Serratia (in: enterobacteria)]|uniref:hypothetical protein n=1 Tax=unclassified Serratia (in: enterobacteria) TaxID=2647522 RepID=UPI002118E051
SYVKNTNMHSEIRSYREEGNKRAGKIFQYAAGRRSLIQVSPLVVNDGSSEDKLVKNEGARAADPIQLKSFNISSFSNRRGQVFGKE